MEHGNITVIGSLMVDHIFFIGRMPDIGETYAANRYEKAPGGKGANSSIATYRTCHHKVAGAPGADPPTSVDIHVRMVGAVGHDTEGDYMLQALTDNKIDVSGVRRETRNTGMMFVMVEELGESRDNRLISTIGANDALEPNDFSSVAGLSNNGVQPDLIVSQLEINLRAVEKMLETAGSAKIPVLLNAAPANNILSTLYQHVTHLVVNESEAAILSGCSLGEVNPDTWADIANGFIADGIENVVITLGASGAFYANHKTRGHEPSFKVDVVDPTGAGDTFTGTYAAEYVRQKKTTQSWNIGDAVIRACAAGALSVRKTGAQEGIPWADEIDEFIATAERYPNVAIATKL